MDSHHMSQHGKARERRWTWTDAATGGGGGEPQTYWIEFPKGGTKVCPVEGCPGRTGTWTAMRVHFWIWHVRDIVIILEEGNLPHPRCPQCDMLVPWRALNGRHKNTEMCRSGRKRRGDDWRRRRSGTARRWPSPPPVVVSSCPPHSCTFLCSCGGR